MSWLEQLYLTYENAIQNPENQNATRKPLLPPYHTLQNAHIEIILDENGNFIDVNPVNDKADQEIIIPCTEKSASRTSGEAPHPLCDKIQYCAKDYQGNKKCYFSSYFSLLKAWKEFDPTNRFLTAIYKYVEKGTLCTDVLSSSKIKLKSNQDIGDLLVRWIVEIPGENETKCWKRKDLYESWKRFNETESRIEDVCFVTGIKSVIAINHPKRVRNSGDGAKLISSNDKEEFTFLGKFYLNEMGNEKLPTQAAAVSVDVSQKAHSTLRWLIERQGFKNGNQVIVSFTNSGKTPPDIFASTSSIFDESNENLIEETSKASYSDLGQAFAKKLNSKMAGYRAELGNTDKIIVIGLDSAGPGRIAITYYRELGSSEFIDRIETWHQQMAWHFYLRVENSGKKNQIYGGYTILAPSPSIIAEACYGPKRDEDFQKYKKSVIERLLHCIIDGSPIPEDLLNTVVRKVSNPLAYPKEKHWQWEQALSVACALYRCYSERNTNLKIKYDMALEKNRNDRDYLYGRLLAVAEHIEEIALNVAKENRETNAARLMQQFADHPYSTWRNIESALRPYISRLNVNRPGFLQNMQTLLDEIHGLFKPGDYENDSRLSGLYLLGYHCQRLEFKKEKNQHNLEESNNE